MKILLPILTIFFFFIIQCGDFSISGNGTGTDAGESKIAGSVKLPNGSPARNVTVTIRKQDYIPDSGLVNQIEKTVIASNGAFSFDQIQTGYYLLELWNKDSLAAMKRICISSDSVSFNTGDIFLETLKTFHGIVVLNDSIVKNARVLVLGTNHSTITGDSGQFSIKLPPAQQIFRIISNSSDTFHELLWNYEDSGDTILLNKQPFFVLEDFNIVDNYNNLHEILGNGYWFVFTDKIGGGQSRITPAESAGISGAIVNTDAYDGYSLHVNYDIDETFNAPYALIGLDINGTKDSLNNRVVWFDLRKMSALTFMAKGSGRIIVEFTSRYEDFPNVYIFPYRAVIDLTSAWKKYSITSLSISDAAISETSISIPWSTGASAISNITFLATEDADLWLDDITFEGLSVVDLIE